MPAQPVGDHDSLAFQTWNTQALAELWSKPKSIGAQCVSKLRLNTFTSGCRLRIQRAIRAPCQSPRVPPGPTAAAQHPADVVFPRVKKINEDQQVDSVTKAI